MASGVAVLLKGLHHVSPWLLFGISAIIECHKTSKTRHLNDTADTQLHRVTLPQPIPNLLIAIFIMWMKR